MLGSSDNSGGVVVGIGEVLELSSAKNRRSFGCDFGEASE